MKSPFLFVFYVNITADTEHDTLYVAIDFSVKLWYNNIILGVIWRKSCVPYLHIN